MVEVVVSYAAGTSDMLNVCLSSLRRHDAGESYAVVVLAGDNVAYGEAVGVAYDFGLEVRLYDSTGARTSSGRHARMLDAALRDCKQDYFLTLDSDCFPVADGWLYNLISSRYDVFGILWPWTPPPVSISKKTIEWRLRRQHCWDNTQVACQLIRTATARSMGLKFGDPDGDDNNFGLMDKIHAAGMSVGGWMPTRCALSDVKDFDIEMNRHVCVVYNDFIYHHGGASREKQGEFHVDGSLFGTARERVLGEKGAEWILEDGQSYIYKMDREEDVAQFKMNMVYRDAITFLQKSSSMFGGGWV